MVAALLVIGLPLAALSLWVEPARGAPYLCRAELASAIPSGWRAASPSIPTPWPGQVGQPERVWRKTEAVAELSRSIVAPTEMVNCSGGC